MTQKTILVTDDNALNVELVVSLIQKYCIEKEYPINILTANNGQAAINICDSSKVDLIFMDYMMPILDGCEATRLIKKKYPEIMIVVISTLGDEDKQKEMLANGAEDYITKPLIASVFNSRLHNYIQLLHHRNHISNVFHSENIVTSQIYNYNIKFTVSSEEDLTEFWEATLIRFDLQQKAEDTTYLVHFVYSLGTLQLKNKFKFQIIIEENLENFYFTLTNIKLLGCSYIIALIEKYFGHALYECQDNKLTFILEKNNKENEVEEPVVQENLVPKEETLTYVSHLDEKLQTYDIIDDQDLSDLEEYLHKIRSIILLMENSNLDTQEIDSLASYLHLLSSILAGSHDTFTISHSLENLSIAIAENRLFFEENSKMLFEFTNAFINDLIFWKTKIFYDGAPSVDFLNDSIQTNANMLNALLKPEENIIENLDDIFDF